MKKGGQVIKLKDKTTVWKWGDASCRSLVTNLACGSHLSVTLGMYFLIDHCTEGAFTKDVLHKDILCTFILFQFSSACDWLQNYSTYPKVAQHNDQGAFALS